MTSRYLGHLAILQSLSFYRTMPLLTRSVLLRPVARAASAVPRRAYATHGHGGDPKPEKSDKNLLIGFSLFSGASKHEALHHKHQRKTSVLSYGRLVLSKFVVLSKRSRSL
ncbi:hypothetical protein BC937DRAFT_87809 [Endogone sp. FLAS-F59071]|nr:hypothetical protein BC937DRAFT_87809 [Endogone sp. FLAS-F59071]|eukprot:RUS19224.1 hypothetical protein BC937DRAFT_87809 [Endogone sp. FLAS-F59071]